MTGPIGPPELAAQFTATYGPMNPFGSEIEQISSTLFAVRFLVVGLVATQTDFTPNTPPFLSRLGVQLPAFDHPVPLP